MNRLTHKRETGFSLLELTVVVAIMFVVAAMAAPKMITALAQYRLKSTASDLAVMIQKCRMEAVKTNQTVALNIGTTANGETTVFLDKLGGTAGSYDAGEPLLVLPRQISLVSSGYPGDAKAGLAPTTTLVTWNPTPAQFNARGLPCVFIGTVCHNLRPDNNYYQGFLYYLRGDSTLGPAGWSAVTVTPAGRIRATIYTGSSGGYK